MFPDNQSNGRVPSLHLPGLAVSLAVPRLAGSLKQEAKNAVEKDKVIKVCSNQGGWQYRNKKPTGDKPPRANLCISKDKFKFFTVRLSVKEEEKNLIPACDLVGNNKLCRPVHFEPNPTNHNYGDHKEAARGFQGGPAK